MKNTELSGDINMDELPLGALHQVANKHTHTQNRAVLWVTLSAASLGWETQEDQHLKTKTSLLFSSPALMVVLKTSWM